MYNEISLHIHEEVQDQNAEITSTGENVEELEPLCSAGGNAQWGSYNGEQHAGSSKAGNRAFTRASAHARGHARPHAQLHAQVHASLHARLHTSTPYPAPRLTPRPTPRPALRPAPRLAHMQRTESSMAERHLHTPRTAELPTTAREWKRRAASEDGWTSKIRFIQRMTCYSVSTWKEILSHATAWMNTEDITLTEVS